MTQQRVVPRAGGRQWGRIIVLAKLAIFISLLLVGQLPVLAQSVALVSGGVNRAHVPAGQSTTVTTDFSLGDLVVGDEQIAAVHPITSRSFYVLGKEAGTTSVAAYNQDGQLVGTLQVEVGVDLADLRLALRQAAPNSRIDVQTANGRLRLAGTVPDAVTLQKVLEIAEQYGPDSVINALKVASAQQVALEVRFIEVSRRAGRELGIGINATHRNDQSGRGLTTGLPGLPSGSTPFGTLMTQIIDAGIGVELIVRALEEKGLARRLAEPVLVALSGETASFLAGGRVPIPVAGEDGQVSVQFENFGVQLTFAPVVLDSGLINLRLEPEVSQIDPTVSIVAGGIQVPGFTTRRAATTVELRDGQSFAIAGLLQAVHTKTQAQLPWLGQLPVIGALFRSSSFQKQETELVIIVTPRLVRPAAPGEQLRTPLDDKRPSNDAEFFLLGMLEVDEDMLRRFYNGEGVVGPYGHLIDVPKGKPSVHKK